MKSRIAIIAAFALPSAIFGQSLNVDLDTPGPPELGGGVPSSTFGAAANQPGVWNSVSVIGGADWLYDLNGIQRPITITLGSSSPTISGGGFNNPANTGDFAKLLNDEGSVDGLWRTWTFHGLANGTYLVTTYAVKPSGSTFQALVSVNGGATAISTGPMPGNQLVLGVTHVVQSTQVANGQLEILVSRPSTGPIANVNGFQITMVPEPATVSALSLAFAGLFARRKRR